MGKKKAPGYATTTTDTGLFGKATTSRKGSTFSPTDFQKNLIGVTEANAVNALNNYLNPDYESEDYKRGDEYYTNKMNNLLENNYLNPALSKNLLRGSTANDIMRGFANDLATTEYERQQQYKADQLQKYMAAMMPYTTIYDMSKGTQGLSNALSNAVSNYNLQAYQANQAGGSGLGQALGAMSSMMDNSQQNAQAAAPFLLAASDVRLKENIEKVAEVGEFNIYKFDYINGDKNQIGVIAQEMQNICPECVVDDGAFLQVDYSKLPQGVQDKIKELKNG